MINAIRNLIFIKKTFFFVILILFIYSKISFSSEIYESFFYHIEIKTNNASNTKNEEIKKIKIKSLYNIIDKILDDNNKNIFKKKFNYSIDFDKIFKNMIIENEIITKNKYIADVRINFQKKDLVSLLRNYNINYTDNISNPYLIVTSYTSIFTNFGLSKKNNFYIRMLNTVINDTDYLIRYKLPKLNANDRFMLSYKDILNLNLDSLDKISKKYNNIDLLISNIEESNQQVIINNYVFDSSKKKIFIIDSLNIENKDLIVNKLFFSFNEWWKKNNEIDNFNLNKVSCKIQSKSFSNLNYIRSEIKDLSQLKSITTKIIEYNNNEVSIEYFGSFDLLKSNLLKFNINIYKEKNNCLIGILN